MHQTIFADTIGAVHITGNLVRLDLTTIQPGKEGGQEINCRVVIPLEGFVGAFNLQEQLIRQLTQNGVLVDGRMFPSTNAEVVPEEAKE